MLTRNITLFLACIMLITFAGVLQVAAAEDPEVMMATRQAMVDSLNAHNEDYLAYLTDDVVEAAAAYFGALYQGFPDIHWDTQRVLVSGDTGTLVVEYLVTGTHSAEWSGIAATGNSMQLMLFEIFDFEGDKVKRITCSFDSATLMMQLGVMPAPEPLELVPSFTLPDAVPTGLSPLEAAEELNARWNAHDLVSHAEMIHPDAELLIAALGVPMDRDAYIAVEEMHFLAFSDGVGEHVRLIDIGDGWVAAEEVFTGTHDGPYLGIPATGNSVTLRAGVLRRFDADGLLTNMNVYYDSMAILAQIGALGPEVLPPEDLLAVHDGFRDALNAQDAEQVASYYADDAVCNYLPAPTPATGKEEVAAFFGVVFQGLPDFYVEQRRKLVSGNIMVTECTVTATHQGEWMGIPATGNSVQFIHMCVYDFEGDKIKRHTIYDDAASQMMQLGVMPTPEPLELVPSFTLPDAEATGLAPLEAAENAMSVWNTHDLDSYAKLIHSDADVLLAPMGVPLDRNAFIATQELYFLAYSDIQQETVRLVDMEDGWVVAEVVFIATNDGPYFGIPATGNSVEVKGAWLGRYDADGLMTNLSVYWDELTGLTQLGLFPPPPDTEANKAIVRRGFEEVWNQKNLDVIDEICATDRVMHHPSGDPSLDVTGVEGFKQFVATYVAAFPDIQWTVEDMIAEGDMVATRYTITATSTGEFMGIPPTGKEGTVTGISIDRIAGGKIVESWGNYDELGMFQQLGAIPPDREDFSWRDPSEVTGAPGDPEENKATVLRHFEEIWNQGNLDVIDEILSPESILHDPTNPEGVVLGVEPYKQYVTMSRTAFPDIHITIEDTIAEGDKVVARWTVTGTQTGDLPGIPATGKRITMTGISIDRLADGKFVEGWLSQDTLGMLQQLGVIPPLGQAEE